MRPTSSPWGLLFAASANAAAVPWSTPERHETCTEIQIPVTISEPRYNIDIVVRDNWDAAALTFNLTNREFGTTTDPSPISGDISSPIESNFTIGSTLCGEGDTILITTHGIIESKLYFQPNFSDSHPYSFVDAAVDAGYSVLNNDRIGVASSSKIDACSDAQFQVEVAVLNALVSYARQTRKSSKVVLVGHSYGAYISAQSAGILGTAVDGLVLTGFSGTLEYFAPFAAGAGFRVAKLQDPERWGHLQSGYLTSSDLYAETFAYFVSPHFDHHVAEWSYDVNGEPFAVGELPTLMAAISEGLAFPNITASTLVLQGTYDTSACGGYCVGLLDNLTATFAAAKALQTVDDLPSGHDLFLHKVAPQAFETIFNFLEEQGI